MKRDLTFSLVLQLVDLGYAWTMADIVSKDIQALSAKYSKSLIDELKKDFPQESDETIARFLIARNGDHHKAREMMQAYIEWRVDHPQVLKETCLGEILKGKVYLHGKDKEGHPLVHFRPRFNDPDKRDLEEMGRMVRWWADLVIAGMPPEITKCTILVDRTDVQTPDLPFLRAFASEFQNNYPERVHRIIVYPGGYLFTMLWNVVKWFLDPVTQEKVKPVLYLEGVQEFIDNEFIPVSMGGECHYEFDHSGGDLPSDLAPPKANTEASPRTEDNPPTVFPGVTNQTEKA